MMEALCLIYHQNLKMVNSLETLAVEVFSMVQMVLWSRTLIQEIQDCCHRSV